MQNVPDNKAVCLNSFENRQISDNRSAQGGITVEKNRSASSSSDNDIPYKKEFTDLSQEEKNKLRIADTPLNQILLDKVRKYYQDQNSRREKIKISNDLRSENDAERHSLDGFYHQLDVKDRDYLDRPNQLLLNMASKVSDTPLDNLQRRVNELAARIDNLRYDVEHLKKEQAIEENTKFILLVTDPNYITKEEKTSVNNSEAIEGYENHRVWSVRKVENDNYYTPAINIGYFHGCFLT